MKLSWRSWRRLRSLVAMGVGRTHHRLRSPRTHPERFWLESLELRCTPSISVALAWSAGLSSEGQFQAINLQLSEPSTVTLVISLSALPASTADASDYWLSAWDVTFQPGQTAHTVIATYWIDDIDEPIETIVIGISGSSSVSVVEDQNVFVGEIQNLSSTDATEPQSTSSENVDVGPVSPDDPVDDDGTGDDPDGDPSDPDGPTGPEDPEAPTDPSDPDGPGDPEDDPSDPDDPNDPDDDPTDPEDPLNPNDDPDDDGGDGDDNPDDDDPDPDGPADDSDDSDDSSGDPSLPQVNFKETTGIALEGQFQTTTLVLSQPTGMHVHVTLACVDSTATYGADYSLGTHTVVFSPGETEVDLVATILMDSFIEPSEQYSIRIEQVTYAVIGPRHTFDGTIENYTESPDSAEAFVLVRGARADEGDVLRFKVELKGDYYGLSPVEVTYEIDDPFAAQEGIDFERNNRSVVLSPGRPVGWFEIYAFRDPLEEGEEKFYITNVDAANLSVKYDSPELDGPGKTVGYIDDLLYPELILDETLLIEGRSGFMYATLTYPLDVYGEYLYGSRNGTATTTAGDYYALGGYVTFAPGQTVQRFAVNSRTDKSLNEPEEHYLVDVRPVHEPAWLLATGKVRIRESGYSWVDLGIDSDNDGKISSSDEPLEEQPDKPGKYLAANDGDDDRDGVVGWADFSGEGKFVPVDLSVNGPMDWASATFTLAYEASDPAGVDKVGEFYRKPGGQIRLWRTSEARNPNDVIGGGDYLAPDTYTAEELGLSEAVRQVRWFAEGVESSTSLGGVEISIAVSTNPTAAPLFDRVRATVIAVDLDVDSLNDGGLSNEHEDQIEFDPNRPGKIVATNTLDYDANGVPGFADGMNRSGDASDERSTNFAQATFELSPTINPAVATVQFQYLAADPSLVKFDANDSNAINGYSAGSTHPIRLWMRDGDKLRRVESISEGGDFVPSGTFSVHDLYERADSVIGVMVYIEGITESDVGTVVLSVRVDPDGPAGPARAIISDRIRLSVAHLQIVYADVSGITGPAFDIQRIPSDEEPDGLTADWQPGVADGSLLLMRVVTSRFLHDLATTNQVYVVPTFGEITLSGNTPSFGMLSERNGYFVKLDDANFFSQSRFSRFGNRAGEMALQELDIEGVSTEFNSSGRYVLAAQFYRPPNEFDERERADDLGPKWRQINLAVNLFGDVTTVGTKPAAIMLARAPIVTVHGINSDPSVWDSFVEHYDRGYLGWHIAPFRVDHSGQDLQFPEQKETAGNGEITSVFEKVAAQINRATSAFRAGKLIPLPGTSNPSDETLLFPPNDNEPLRVAIQKVDIVAHSYGGLLARWYVEQANIGSGFGSNSFRLFESRRDVHRLITLGTPHKGTPFANLVAEGYKDGLIAGSFVHGENGLGQLNVRELLEQMRSGEPSLNFVWFDGSKPVVRPSYEALAVNSEILDVLNHNPFHDDVGYAAIVGTDIMMPSGTVLGEIDLFQFMQPISDVEGNLNNRALFPWLKEFNPGPDDSDSVVPRWSAILGDDRYNFYVEANHSDLPQSVVAQEMVSLWLRGRDEHKEPAAISRGAAHRPAFVQRGIPVSERNAYVGSIYRNGLSVGAGVNRNAIVKVELLPDAPDTDPAYGVYEMTDDFMQAFQNAVTFGTAANEVGAHAVALTGMIQWGHRNRLSLSIISEGWGINSVLHDLGVLTESRLSFALGDTLGIQDDDWIAFRVVDGRIGRMPAQRLTGPNGIGFNGADQWVSYRLSLSDGATAAPSISGHSRVYLPEYSLPPPLVTGADGLKLVVSGSVAARNTALGRQEDIISLWDDDGLVGDDLLARYLYTTVHNDDVWDGLLVGYEFEAVLWRDPDGMIAGIHGSSLEPEAQVYQQLSADWLDAYSGCVVVGE